MDQIQKIAIKKTFIFCASALAAGVAISVVIHLVPSDWLSSIFAGAALIFGTKMIYDINVAEARFKEKYNKTVDQ
jgi:uncharacterized membrane protein YfcA